ncbi:hypothetical protein ATHEMM101B_09380 [Atlantibacter hermannii]|nr:Uncharacterised protein [Atlantibacter hermannii]
MRCPMIFSRQLSAVIPQKTFLYGLTETVL